MTLEEASGPPVDLWPEHVTPVRAFVGMSTQWRVGPGGAYGLDYTALQPVLRLMAIPRSEWPDVFECIRVMESAALEQIKANK